MVLLDSCLRVSNEKSGEEGEEEGRLEGLPRDDPWRCRYLSRGGVEELYSVCFCSSELTSVQDDLAVCSCFFCAVLWCGTRGDDDLVW